eukprot:jgi/Tetstr1/439732/TSEL_028151.t1
MTELVRSWDDARTEAFYAGHARQRRTDADLFAALLGGTADTVVALQLKQHVAAGTSGMRNEYLRCLVGEYALASGPAAVYAISEVTPMYLQVGEAERRAAERAVVDNMKEAYVSVLAPSQLGVGISAGDSMLSIASGSSPRSLAHVPSLFTPTTLEVTDGAARFNADDGFLVGIPEHVWPALHAFRTSIKASVGLEVRFDKMQAYIADMEAARREAPADIEWPELDGHHGIAVLSVPLGSPEYVHAYIRRRSYERRWTLA